MQEGFRGTLAGVRIIQAALRRIGEGHRLEVAVALNHQPVVQFDVLPGWVHVEVDTTLRNRHAARTGYVERCTVVVRQRGRWLPRYRTVAEFEALRDGRADGKLELTLDPQSPPVTVTLCAEGEVINTYLEPRKTRLLLAVYLRGPTPRVERRIGTITPPWQR